MARVTVEDCLEHVDNMYELVHLATKRSRMLYKGDSPMMKTKNRIIVTALREIAAGKVKAKSDKPASIDGEDMPLTN